jgi:FtsZ-binding cell division protein ZapB
LSLEFLDELEKKVDGLIQNLEELREENAGLKKKTSKKAADVPIIEKENNALKKEVNTLKVRVYAQQEKLKIAAERVRGLMGKIAAI